MIEQEVELLNKLGLHARPSTRLAEVANRFQAGVKLGKGDVVVDAKSILNLLTLGATKGTRLRVIAEGPDEEEAVRAIVQLFASRFGFEE